MMSERLRTLSTCFASGLNVVRSPRIHFRLLVLAVVVGGLLGALAPQGSSPSALAQARGREPALSASVSLSTSLIKTFEWSITKSASPTSLDLEPGERGRVKFTIGADRDDGTLSAEAAGRVCVTNKGSSRSEGLSITVRLFHGDTVLQTVAVPVDRQVRGGDRECFPFRAGIPAESIVPGASYSAVALVQASSHAGATDTDSDRMPTRPELENDEIRVIDSNGDRFNFSSDGFRHYDESYQCPRDRGANVNTARIRETGAEVSATVFVECLEPDLAIVKSHDGEFVRGGSGTYKLAVSNVGTARSQGPVVVVDDLPDGVAVISLYGEGWNCVARLVKCSRNDSLLPGQSFAPISVEVTILESAADTITNSASVSGRNDSRRENNTALDVAAIGGEEAMMADLAIAKTDGLTEVVPGQELSYTITVANNGPSDVADASVVDTLPEHFNVTGQTAPLGVTFTNAGDGEVKWTGIEIPAGGQVTLTLVGQVDEETPSGAGTFINSAAVSPPDGVVDSDPTNNNATDVDNVGLEPTSLAMTLAVDGVVQVNRSVTTPIEVTIIVSNTGDAPAAGVLVTGLLVEGLTYDSHTATNGTYDPATGTWMVGSIAPGASVTLTITTVLAPEAFGTISFAASVSAENATAAGVQRSTDQGGRTLVKRPCASSVRPGPWQSQGPAHVPRHLW